MLHGNGVIWTEKGDLKYIQFSNLKKYGNKLSHAFTTRLGGVSEGECNSLNMGFNRNDTRENVLKNYRIIADALDIKCENMVLSRQVHGINIREVAEEDRGKGIFRENDLDGCDGLMTNIKNIALVTFYADCVPVFFFDPVKTVIAIAHSGWRGTVGEISGETIRKMSGTYGCNPGDIQTAIGPSIGLCCFEVGEEVYSEFINRLSWSDKFCKKTGKAKWHINLQGIIKQSLLNSGIRAESIVSSDICTKCNTDIFFSHRGDSGKTGSLTAIMQLI